MVGNSGVSQLKGKELGRRQLLYPIYSDLWHDVEVETIIKKEGYFFRTHLMTKLGSHMEITAGFSLPEDKIGLSETAEGGKYT